jgi:hypothetical protein
MLRSALRGALARCWRLRVRGLRRASAVIRAGVAGPLSVHFSSRPSGTVRHSSPILIGNTSSALDSGSAWPVPAPRSVSGEAGLQAPGMKSDRVPFNVPPKAWARSAPRHGHGVPPRIIPFRSGTGWLARSASATASAGGRIRCSGPFRAGGFRVPVRITTAGAVPVFLSAALAFRRGWRNAECRICGQLRAGRRVVHRNVPGGCGLAVGERDGMWSRGSGGGGQA